MRTFAVAVCVFDFETLLYGCVQKLVTLKTGAPVEISDRDTRVHILCVVQLLGKTRRDYLFAQDKNKHYLIGQTFHTATI